MQIIDIYDMIKQKAERSVNDMNVITQLKGPDRVRCRPAVIFGSTGTDAVLRTFEMLLDIMTSECQSGFSNKLVITQHLDHTISFQDFGRGLFLGNDDSRIWKNLFCEIFPSSPYSHIEYADYSLLFSDPAEQEPAQRECFELCAVQYVSEYMNVRVQRDSFQSDLHFEKGYNIGGLTKLPFVGDTYTHIAYKPDADIFSDISLPTDMLMQMAQAKAICIHGARIVFRKETVSGFSVCEFCYPNGISDYLEQDKIPTHSTPVYTASLQAEGQERYNLPKYAAKLQVGLYFTAGSGKLECFHNHRKLTGGTHMDALAETIRQSLEWTLARPVSKKQVLSCVRLVAASDASRTCWVNGTRTSIENTLIKDMAQDILDDRFQMYLKENVSQITSILHSH